MKLSFTIRSPFLGFMVLMASSCSTVKSEKVIAERKLASRSFLETCGHAPVRMVLSDLQIVPTFEKTGDASVDTHRTFFALKNCSKGPCFQWGGQQPPAHFIPASGLDSQSLADDLVTGTLSQTARVELGVPLRISSLSTINYAGDSEEISAPNEAKLENTVALKFSNRDLTIEQFMAALAGNFSVDYTDVKCPLSAEEQSESCNEGKIPYDPSTKEVMETARAYYKSEDFKKLPIGDRFDERQNSRGYSYISEYVDTGGIVIESTSVNRYTKNVYRILNSLTRSPCRGWKISKFAINGHRGRSPYAHYAVKNAKGEIEKQDTQGLELAAIRDRAESIYSTYAHGAELTFNLCYSLNQKDKTNSGIGNVFMKLDPTRNPIGSIRGASGLCTTLSGRADAGMVPKWLGKIVGSDYTEGKNTWVNPNFK